MDGGWQHFPCDIVFLRFCCLTGVTAAFQAPTKVTEISHDLIIFPPWKQLVTEGTMFNGICVKLNYTAMSTRNIIQRRKSAEFPPAGAAAEQDTDVGPERSPSGRQRPLRREVKPLIRQHCNLMGRVFTAQWLCAPQPAARDLAPEEERHELL